MLSVTTTSLTLGISSILLALLSTSKDYSIWLPEGGGGEWKPKIKLWEM